jgi:hypothetical protein
MSEMQLYPAVRFGTDTRKQFSTVPFNTVYNPAIFLPGVQRRSHLLIFIVENKKMIKKLILYFFALFGFYKRRGVILCAKIGLYPQIYELIEN